MGFKFPKSCENAIVEEMSSAAKDVFSSVFDGKAFKNPLGGAMGKAGNLLSGDLGLDEFGLPIPNMLDNLDSLIADASGGQKDALENMKTQLFGSIPGTPGLPDVAGGLMGQLDSLKSHTDMLSGVGDLDAFTERLGMAGSLDGAMQRLGKGEGAFGNMFQSIENVGGMMNDVQGKLDSVKGMLDGGLDNINMGDLAAGAMSMGGLGDKLMGQIDLDNSVFNSAKNLVQKMGIADMISTNNCYIKEMMDGAIGTPNLKENLPAVLEEKFGPEFDENQQQAVEQVEEISKEEIKASGVHDDVLASVVGSNIVKTEEDIKKVAGRPVFEPIKLSETNPDKNIVSDSELPYLKLLEGKMAQLYSPPVWHDDIKGADGKPGVWIQWYAHASEQFDIPNKVVTSPAVYKQSTGSYKGQVLVKEEVAYDWNGFGGNLYYLDIFDSFSPAVGWDYGGFMRLEDVSGRESGIGREYGKFHKLYCEALMWNTKLNTWTSKKISKDMDVKLHPWENQYGGGYNKDAIWGDVELADGIILGYDWPQVVVSSSGEPYPKHFSEGGKLYYSLYNPVL